MTNKNLDQKLAQYREFFSIEHNFSVNITPLLPEEIIDFEHFLAKMPLPFKIASDMSSIDQAALRPLQGLGGVASQLVEFLNLQAQKIDLLTGYILSQQDEESHRFQGIKMGGGGVKFTSEQPLALGDMLEMKLFLHDDHSAVYCFGEVIDISQVDVSNSESNKTAQQCPSIAQYHHKVIFHFIREEDREILVRASLHQQSKQLQKLAQQRNSERNQKH